MESRKAPAAGAAPVRSAVVKAPAPIDPAKAEAAAVRTRAAMVTHADLGCSRDRIPGMSIRGTTLARSSAERMP
jgi:hypothetical protein